MYAPAGLRLCYSLTPEDRFSCVEAQLIKTRLTYNKTQHNNNSGTLVLGSSGESEKFLKFFFSLTFHIVIHVFKEEMEFTL